MSDLVERLRNPKMDVLTREERVVLIIVLLNEAADEIERLECSGIHSCHDNCLKIECVQRRRIEELEKRLERAAPNKEGLSP